MCVGRGSSRDIGSQEIGGIGSGDLCPTRVTAVNNDISYTSKWLEEGISNIFIAKQ